MMLIVKIIILLCSLGLHDHPHEEWVDLGVAALMIVAPVLQDEAKTHPRRQCASFYVSVTFLVCSLDTGTLLRG
jgi:hypothetical protein